MHRYNSTSYDDAVFVFRANQKISIFFPIMSLSLSRSFISSELNMSL